MVVSAEVRGKHGRGIWTGPSDQLAGLQVIACEELIAFCLMSTHFHLVLEVENQEHAEKIVRRITRRLDATADERGVARLDEPHFEVLGDAHAVLRYAAYAHANPVRAEMVDDPLSWPFSSHRDVYGLRRAAWFSPDRLLLRMGGGLDERWLHRKAEGRLPAPMLVEPIARDHPTESLDLIARAVAAAFGIGEDELHTSKRSANARACLASVARFDGWRSPAIADFLDWSGRHARRVPLEDTLAVRAVIAALGDVRLRPTGGAWWEVPAEARGPRLWREWRESHRNLAGANR